MLIIKYPGNRNTLFALEAAAFSRVNYANPAFTRAFGRISAATPNGALGGMVAKLVGDYEVGIMSSTGIPVGIFLNDAAGQPFENSPAIASGKLSVMTEPGEYETDIYETVNENNTPLATAWAAAIGLPLYASDFGLLTTENTGSGIVGYVTKTPSANNVFLGFKTII
jgi:hypothetical protein